MPDTCRHEWVMGDDACVNCGESWASLHPEEELAPAARRGLNRLLASFPAAAVVHVGRPEGVVRRLLGHEMPTPWLAVDLGGFKQPERLRRFAIWKFTGDVYELGGDGAVGDDPVIRVLGEPCAVCGYDNACGDPPGEDCHS